MLRAASANCAQLWTSLVYIRYSSYCPPQSVIQWLRWATLYTTQPYLYLRYLDWSLLYLGTPLILSPLYSDWDWLLLYLGSIFYSHCCIPSLHIILKIVFHINTGCPVFWSKKPLYQLCHESTRNLLCISVASVLYLTRAILEWFLKGINSLLF